MTAADAHETLQELRNERAALVMGAVAVDAATVAELDVMIRDTHAAWVGAAVTEIASLRGMLSGRQRG